LSQNPIGRRGSADGKWSWGESGPEERGPRRTRRRFLLALATLAAGGALLVALVWLLTGSGGDGPAVHITPTAAGRSQTPGVSAAPTAVASPTTLPTPAASPSPTKAAATLSLQAWNKTAGKWQTDHLSGPSPIYREGEAVPFLLRLDRLIQRTHYIVQINIFHCALAASRSFDYLAPIPAESQASLLAAPGPGITVPDAVATAPDDPSVQLDNDRGFAPVEMWGAVFEDTPAWQAVPDKCPQYRTLSLKIVAQIESVHIAWAAHLASAADWPGQGAAAAGAPLVLTAGIPDLVSGSEQVLPGSVFR